MSARLLIITAACAGAGCYYTNTYTSPDLGGSTIVVTTATATADGVTPVGAVVSARQQSGAPIVGATITVSADSCRVVVLNAVTDANGVVQAVVTSTIPGPHTLVAHLQMGNYNTALPITRTIDFVLSDPNALAPPHIAGVGGSVTVSLGSTGVLHMTSTDPNATLPDDYTMLAQDGGKRTFVGSVTFRTAGSQTLNISNVSTQQSTSQTFNIVPAAASGFALSIPGQAVAGMTLPLQVSAVDPFNNTDPNYVGTVQFFSSDTQAVIPGTITFTATDAGHKLLTNALLLHSAGSQWLRVADVRDASLSGTLALQVQAGLAVSLKVVSSPSATIAGQPFTVVVQASDASGNPVPGYSGTLLLQSSDANAVLCGACTFGLADGGVHTINNLVLKTAGAQSINISDTSGQLSATQVSSIAVSAAVATTLQLTVPSHVLAGQTFGGSVTALDAYGNVATGYVGRVTLQSSDPQAELNPDMAFVPSDDGVHGITGALILATAGLQTISVNDIDTPSINGSTQVTVAPGAAARLALALSPNATAGQNITPVVTALDTYGNLTTSYAGLVFFASNDAQASLPTAYTFTGADAGVHTFTSALTLRTAGSRVVAVADGSGRGVLSGSASIDVLPGPAANLVLSGLPQVLAAGRPTTVQLAVADAFGNGVPTYWPTVHFTSDDSAATLPADYTFTQTDNGIHTFNGGVILRTTQTSSVTVQDVANPNLVANANNISVSLAAGTLHLAVQGMPSTVTAGDPNDCVVTVLDSLNQVESTYTGTVMFTSTDTNAVLPVAYTFTNADLGTHAFSGLALTTAGTQSITVTDTVNPNVNGIIPNIRVNAAAAAHLQWSEVPNPVTAGQALTTPLLQARDAYGNIAPTYRGTVQVTSSDTNATLPANYTFTATDSGSHGVSGITLISAGPQTLTVNDGALPAAHTNLTVNPAPLAALTVSTVTSTGAGSSINLTLTASDAFGNLATNYTGTVMFSSSDVQASLPAAYTFSPSDAGTRVLNAAAVLKTAGNQTVQVTDSTAHVTGASAPIAVSPAAAAAFVWSGLPTSLNAGTNTSATLQAVDVYGNTANYVGTVRFASSDTQATLPSNYTFTSLDAGVHTFSSIAWLTSGLENLTATDTSNSSIYGVSAWITINAGTATLFNVGYVTSTTAGSSISISVTARDSYGNVATGYRGSAAVTSSDAQATLPTSHTFGVSDAGRFTYTGAVLKTVGSQTLTVTDTGNSSVHGIGNTVSVSPGAVASLTVLGSTSSSVAGQSLGITATVRDAYGNTVTGYTGTVHFSSTDGAASLPANYTFTTSDGGTHNFSGAIVLKTAGNQTITLTDTAHGTWTGTSAAVAVSAASASSLLLSGLPSSTTAGTSNSATVAVKDTYGNTITTYTGTVTLQSSDSAATLPGAYTFVASDHGAHTFAGVVLKTSGSQTVTAQDGAGLTSNTSAVTVNASTATTLRVTAPTTSSAGTVLASVAVTARDTYGNTATGYTGTVHFSSTDGQAVLPGNYTFLSGDNGTHSFTTVNLKTAGSITLTVTDTTTGTITGSSSISVSPAAASTLNVAVSPSSGSAGQSFGVTVTARDTYGNTASGYTGTVHFTSTDGQAVLPADTTFTVTNAGVRTFSGLILRTVGSQSVTATDTVTGSINGQQTGIAITAGTATQLQITGLNAATAGTTQSLTVVALDAFGNTATGYRGTVQFASSDTQAALPSNTTFTSTNNGTRAFTGVILKTAASNWVSVTDTAQTAITGTQSGINISPASAVSLTVNGVAGGAAGTASNVKVSAYDTYGNVATGYTGTVQFTSNDTAAALPSNFTFATGNAGTHTFTGGVTLKTVGSRSVTATDTVTGSINGTQSGINVTPGSVAKFVGSGFPATPIAGTLGNCTFTAQDTYGNTVTSYTGTVQITSSDGAAALPANYTFLPGDSGAHVFGVTLKTSGAQTITATDTSQSTVTGNQSGITVRAAAAATLAITNIASNTVTAGTASSVTVQALDMYGNVATTYAGTVHLTTTDPNTGGLPTDHALASGTYTFSNALRLYTAPTQSLTATDTSTSSITGTLSVTVAPNTPVAIQLNLAPLAGAVLANIPSSMTVVAVDTYGNVATQYTGTVAFTSSDTTAVLPATTTFASSDHGSKYLVNSLKMKTAGIQSVTATDSANGLSSTQSYGVMSRLLQQGAGDNSSICTLSSAGGIKCWGQNEAGELGLGDTTDRGTAANQMGTNLPYVSLPTGRTAVNATISGSNTACAVLDDATVRCWGSGEFGANGVGDTSNRGNSSGTMGDALPAIPLGTGYTAHLVGSGFSHTCAILNTNQVKCWGTNGEGELNLGDELNRGGAPTTVGDANPLTLLGTGRTAVSVLGSIYESGALLDNGQIKLWGANWGGMFGLGDGNERGITPATSGDNLPSPAMGTRRRVLEFRVGDAHACAILDTHQLKCWGQNWAGQLGYGDTTTRGDTSTTPMGDNLPYVNLGTGRSAIGLSMGTAFTCVLMDNHQAKCWGYNNYGQLGLGDTTNRGDVAATVPSAMPAISLGTGRTVMQIVNMQGSVCAMLDNGSIKCWGNNEHGELGMGDYTVRGSSSGQMGDSLPVVPSP